MFLQEAEWLKEKISKLGLTKGSRVLDAGSSTDEVRRLVQPSIDFHVYYPLRKKEIIVTHLDAKQASGVDWVCDITGDSFEKEMTSVQPFDLVLCTSLLEHVTDRETVAERLKKLTKSGGTLIVTVPQDYWYHPEPIDTMYRPTPEELTALFSHNDFEIMELKLLRCYEKRILPVDNFAMHLVKFIFQSMACRKNVECVVQESFHVSCVILRKK